MQRCSKITDIKRFKYFHQVYRKTITYWKAMQLQKATMSPSKLFFLSISDYSSNILIKQ